MTKMKQNENNFDTGDLRSDYTNNLNGSSEPPPGESLVSSFCKNYFIPFLIPTATALIGWLANRRYAAQVRHNESLKVELTQLRDDLRDVQQNKGTNQIEDVGKRSVVLKEEEATLQEINKDLDKMSELLEKRQDIYCSQFTRRNNRHQIEEHMKEFSFTRSYDKELRLYSGVIDIIQFDKHCGNYGYHRNGCLMWVYLDMWRTMAKMRKHERVEARLRKEDG